MSMLGRLVRALRPHWRQLALALALSCAALAANVGLLAIAGYLVAAAALKPLLDALAFPMYAVRVLGVGRALLRYGERLVSHRTALSLLADLRVWLFSRLAPLVPALTTRRGSGDLLVRFTADLDELQHLYLRIVSPLAVAACALCAIAAVFAVFSPVLALSAALFLLAAGVGVPVLALWCARGLGARQLATRGTLYDRMVEGIQGMPDLLMSGRASDYVERLGRIERESGRLQMQQARIGGLQAALGALLTTLAVATILALAGWQVDSGHIDGVYLGFLVLLMLAGFEAVQPLGVAFATAGRSLGAARRLLDVADAEPVVRDPTQPAAAPVEPSLRFDRVCFSYNPAADPVLDDVSFHVEPGRWVAVVGPSGAGKSTLTGLALRFWEAGSGSVLVGGAPVGAYLLDDLRASIALVAQDTALFTDTLRNNLRVARPNATDDQMLDALALAQIGDLPAVLPGGLDGWVGEQGLTLSGGERQRLAVARAVLKDAPILILDEATANLDPNTEARLLAAVHARMRERAVLVITHRLIGMERMAEIVVLDRGRVVQRGTHDQLSECAGLYREMLEAQDEVFLA
jgi:ATP-binding cassette subfamily C protein CydC